MFSISLEGMKTTLTMSELRASLAEFESELRLAGLAENTITTYLDRSERFLRYLGTNTRQVDDHFAPFGPHCAPVGCSEHLSRVLPPPAGHTFWLPLLRFGRVPGTASSHSRPRVGRSTHWNASEESDPAVRDADFWRNPIRGMSRGT